MATKRITVSLPTDIANRIKRAVGRRRSVSEWVANAVTRTLEEEDLKQRFLEFCDDVKATPAEEKQAQASFDRIARSEKVSRTKGQTGRGKTAA